MRTGGREERDEEVRDKRDEEDGDVEVEGE